MSRSRINRPLERKLTSSRSASDRNAPETRSEIVSSPVWSSPEGLTAFCALSAAISAARSMPRPASSATENSTKICSFWAPMSSIFDTSGT